MPRRYKPHRLIKYLERTGLAVPTTYMEAIPVIDRMNNDLEDENLWADGERTQQEVNEVLVEITAAKSDLEFILKTKIDLSA